jgi:hypothetical protein
MNEVNELNEPYEVNEIDTDEIARLIQEGYTSGRLDSDGKHIAWELKLNIWNDNEKNT